MVFFVHSQRLAASLVAHIYLENEILFARL